MQMDLGGLTMGVRVSIVSGEVAAQGRTAMMFWRLPEVRERCTACRRARQT
jgi:hypothetical protein